MEEFNTDWWSDRKESLTKKDIEDIIVYFKKKGYYISKKGIIHQWFGWKMVLGSPTIVGEVIIYSHQVAITHFV